MSRVLVVGSVNLDLVVTAATLPRPGETVLGGELMMVPGGKGANQAAAAARAGASCRFVGAVGADTFAPTLRQGLLDAGVDVGLLRTAPGASGTALIAVDGAGENLIVVAPGANAAMTGLDERDLAAIAAADVLLCQLEIPVGTVAQALAAARAAGTAAILNAAPALALPPELLDDVDLLVVNQLEAQAVAGITGGPDELLDELLRRVGRVVMTLGARGALFGDRAGLRLQVPAPRIDAVDTTAAGDAFAGALAVAWAEGRPELAALRWACTAGAICAERPGASSALPTRDEIDAKFVSAYPARDGDPR
jgi:ribokinase